VKSAAVDHVLVTVGTPRANRQVERFNRVITPMLAKLSETPTKWDQSLRDVEFSLNNTVCRATDETPARLLFGLEQRGKLNDLLRGLVQLDAGVERDLGRLRRDAEVNISRAQQQSATRYNLRRKAA